jgi:Xaa-Pro aminopeptidase
MTTAESIPLTGVPFPRREYDRRWRAVSALVEAAGLDAIAVTAHSHQRYLTGYDGSGAYFGPFPVLIAPGKDPIYVVRAYDEDAVRAQSVVEDIRPYTQWKDLGSSWADALRSLGVDRGRLGLELGCWGLAPADVAALAAELPEIEIVDASTLVRSLTAVKSPLEIEMMRRAINLTREAVATFYRSLVEGATESEVGVAMEEAIARGGGSTQPYTLVFGRRTALPHGAPGVNRLERGQPAFTEISGFVHGYAAGLCRTAILGDHPGADALHAVAEEALAAGIDAIRPGATAGSVDFAVRKVVGDAGESATFRHRAGYQIGIDWLERGNISLEPDAPEILAPGMTLHLPVILFRAGEYGVGVSETVLVTEDGSEALSDLPRTVFRAG